MKDQLAPKLKLLVKVRIEQWIFILSCKSLLILKYKPLQPKPNLPLSKFNLIMKTVPIHLKITCIWNIENLNGQPNLMLYNEWVLTNDIYHVLVPGCSLSYLNIWWILSGTYLVDTSWCFSLDFLILIHTSLQFWIVEKLIYIFLFILLSIKYHTYIFIH